MHWHAVARLPALPCKSSPDHQHRQVGMAHHVVRYAAQDQAPYAAAPVGGHHHQGRLLRCLVYDALGHILAQLMVGGYYFVNVVNRSLPFTPDRYALTSPASAPTISLADIGAESGAAPIRGVTAFR